MVDILERPFTVTPKIIKSLKAGRAENHLLIPLTLTTIYPRVDESKLGGSPRIVDTKVRKIEESLQPTPSSCTQRGVLVLPHDFPAREILNQMGKQFEVFVDTDFDADSISEDLSRPIEGSMGALPKHSYKVGEALDVIAVARSIHGGYKAWLARKQSDKEKGWLVAMQHCVVLEGSGWAWKSCAVLHQGVSRRDRSARRRGVSCRRRAVGVGLTADEYDSVGRFRAALFSACC